MASYVQIAYNNSMHYVYNNSHCTCDIRWLPDSLAITFSVHVCTVCTCDVLHVCSSKHIHVVPLLLILYMYMCLLLQDSSSDKAVLERLTGIADQLVSIGDYCILYD